MANVVIAMYRLGRYNNNNYNLGPAFRVQKLTITGQHLHLNKRVSKLATGRVWMVMNDCSSSGSCVWADINLLSIITTECRVSVTGSNDIG